jgi:hypothetical protein
MSEVQSARSYIIADAPWRILLARGFGLFFMAVPLTMAGLTFTDLFVRRSVRLSDVAFVGFVMAMMLLVASCGAMIFTSPGHKTTVDPLTRNITFQKTGFRRIQTKSIPFSEVQAVGMYIKSGGKGGPAHRPVLYLSGDRELHTLNTSMSRRDADTAVVRLAAILGAPVKPPTRSADGTLI